MTAVASEFRELRHPAVHALPPSFISRFLVACDRERILRTLARHIPGATFQFFHRHDGSEGFHYVSPRALRLFGSFREWRRGKYVYAEDRQRLLESVDEAVRTFKPWTFEGRYELRSGQVRWFQGLAHASHRADEVVFNGVLLDIHQRKCAEIERDQALQRERAAREEAEAANRIKDRFIAMVSHELRAPLSPILLTASLLEQDPTLSQEVRADLQVIRQNAELESRLVADLLDCASIRAGKLAVRHRETSLHAAIIRAVSLCEPGIERKKLQLTVLSEAKQDRVWGDQERLCQIFSNILLNAVKFTPEGGSITIRTSDVSAGICIQICDTGAGIDPATLASAFELFAQGPRQGSRGQCGLGLGLYIAQALVQAHGGTLVASSGGPGTGATFTVQLPSVS